MDPARLPEGIPEQFLLDLFIRSGGETVARMRVALQEWTGTGSETALADVRRYAHNLKGASLQLGFDEVARLTSGLERCVSSLLRQQRPGRPEELELLAAAVESAAAALEALASANPLPDLKAVTERLESDLP